MNNTVEMMIENKVNEWIISKTSQFIVEKGLADEYRKWVLQWKAELATTISPETSGMIESKTEVKTPHRMSDTIQAPDGKYYWIDTNDTPDHGWETMVFAAKANGDVTDWGEKDADWYDDFEEAEAGHKAIVEKWKTGKGKEKPRFEWWDDDFDDDLGYDDEPDFDGYDFE